MTDTCSDFAERRASYEAVRAKARALRTTCVALQRQISATAEQLAETLNKARAAHSLVRDHLASLRPAVAVEIAAEVPDAVSAALAAAGFDQRDLDDMMCELIAAYQSAVANDDGEMARQLGEALKLIGRHLARCVGPKAAGVILN